MTCRKKLMVKTYINVVTFFTCTISVIVEVYHEELTASVEPQFFTIRSGYVKSSFTITSSIQDSRIEVSIDDSVTISTQYSALCGKVELRLDSGITTYTI